MTINIKDLGTGLIFCATGIFFGVTAWRTLTIGSVLQMGPGFFPVVLSSLLLLIGLVLIGRSLLQAVEEPFGIIPWRAAVMLSLATISFAIFLERLGMLLSVFAAAFLAGLSSKQTTILGAAIVSACIAVFCVAVFRYGISLPVPVFGSWFGAF